MSRMADFYTGIQESVERVADNLKTHADPSECDPEALELAILGAIIVLKSRLADLTHS